CGEWPHLSPRVKRQLPQSFLGRSLLTWFNPGPGTGYVFVLGNLLAAALAGFVVLAFWYTIRPTGGTRWLTLDRVFFFMLAGYGYVATYLGIGRLIVRACQRVAPVGIALSVLVQLLLLLCGCGI